MAVKVGLDGRAYYSAAGIGTPTWVEIKCRSVSSPLSKGEADVSSRPAGSTAKAFKLSKGTLIEFAPEIEMVADTENPAYLVLRAAFLSGAAIGMAFMSEEITTPGSEGVWADVEVMEMSREEPIEGEMVVTFGLRPTATANAPLWKVVE